MAKTFIAGISGGSAAGKTMVAGLLAQMLARYNPLVLGVDRYFKDQTRLSEKERAEFNYDLPEALDFDQLERDIVDLTNGREARLPVYDYATHSSKAKSELAKPSKLIIVEGILLFYPNKIKPLLDFRIFVEAEADERLRRRIARDTVERGRTEESVIKQFNETVEPAFLKYMKPTSAEADVILDWNLKDMPVLKLLADRLASLVLY